jgi:hypothetical protein
MPKIKAILFILVGTLVHFGLMFTLIVSRIGCEMQPNCVSQGNEIAGAILGFPLNVIAWILYPHGAPASSWYYIFMLLNSLVAVTGIWFLVLRPILRRAKRNGAKA